MTSARTPSAAFTPRLRKRIARLLVAAAGALLMGHHAASARCHRRLRNQPPGWPGRRSLPGVRWPAYLRQRQQLHRRADRAEDGDGRLDWPRMGQPDPAGGCSHSTTIRVDVVDSLPATTLARLEVSSDSFNSGSNAFGGTPASGTVQVSFPAPSSGAVVALASGNRSVASVPPA